MSYRKDDRAMRPTYECPGNFRESLTMPIAHGYFSQSQDRALHYSASRGKKDEEEEDFA